MFNPIETVIYDSWNGNYTEGYDIALLKLDREANLTVPVLAYSNKSLLYGTNLVALGWGTNENNDFEELLQMAQGLEYIPTEKCKVYWKFVKEWQICAGITVSNTCRGNTVLFKLL